MSKMVCGQHERPSKARISTQQQYPTSTSLFCGLIEVLRYYNQGAPRWYSVRGPFGWAIIGKIMVLSYGSKIGAYPQ